MKREVTTAVELAEFTAANVVELLAALQVREERLRADDLDIPADLTQDVRVQLLILAGRFDTSSRRTSDYTPAYTPPF